MKKNETIFNYNTKKEYLSKTVTLLNLLGDEGVLPIFITIALPYKIEINDEENINELLEKIKAVTIRSEQLSIYLYISIEKTKKENVHFHCIWGIRLIQKNNNLEVTIKNELNSVFEDVWVNILNDRKNLNNKIYYIFKNKEIFDKKTTKINLINIYTHPKYQNLDNNNFFSKLMDIDESENWSILHENFENKKQEITNEIELVKTSSIYNNNQDEFTSLILLYLEYNNLYLSEYNIYAKEYDLEISFKKIGTLENIIKEIDFIISYFENISIQLKNYNWYDFKLKNFNKLDEKLNKIKMIYNKKLKIDYNLIEFKDCIINLSTNQKITKIAKNKKLIKMLIKNGIGTNKYKKILYKNIKKPEIWLNLLKKVTNNNFKNINTIKSFISNIFINSEFKKKVLYVVGKSNTFKTTLIGMPLTEFFEEENIGFLSSNSNFTFQDIENKKILLLDEFKYEKKHKKNYLKLFEGNTILVEKKYKKASKEKGNIIFILTNDKLDEKIENDEEILNAIKNRVEIVEFKEYNETQINVRKLKEFIKENNIEIIIWATNNKSKNENIKIEFNEKLENLNLK